MLILKKDNEEKDMKNRIYNTKSIVEAGLITALIVILALMNIYLPVFSTLGRFILPIPVTVLYLRHNFKVTITSIIASGILVGMMYNPLSGLTSAIMFGLAGITLGYCIKNDKKVSITLLFLSLASLIGTLIDFVVYIKIIMGSNVRGFVEEMVKAMNESFNLVMDFYTKMGITQEQLKPFLDILKMFNTDFILKLIPGILIMSSVIFAYLTYIITKLILRKLGYNIKEMPKFTEIYVDIKIATVLAVFLLLGVLLVRKNILIGEYILNSSQLLLQYIFLINGLAVAVHYLKNRFNMSKGFILIIIVFTMFSQFAMVYFMLGLADVILDFRKLDPNRKIGAK